MARQQAQTKEKVKEIPSIVPKTIRYESLKRFEPLTPAQEELYREYNNGQNLFLHGLAGTGKTFLGMYLAMKEILLRESVYDKLIVVRSTVPVRDVGFLPGDLNDKTLPLELPYHAIFKEIFSGREIVEKLIHQGLYQFMSTSYIRGITLHNAIVLVDEFQNLSFSEFNTIMTRLGNDCKIIICGDMTQTDLKKKEELSGIKDAISIVERMHSFSKVHFNVEDIVRSGFVKEYILTKDLLGL